MNWKYIKELMSEESIEAFERLVGFSFPDGFKECVRQYNGARPKCRVFDTDITKGRVMKSLLSFNREDEETMWGLYEWNKDDLRGKYVPFAIDNFGNLICFDREGQVVFIEHETLKVEAVASSFNEFVEGLYLDADYYIDDDTGNIVRSICGCGCEVLEKGSCEWKHCELNSHYYREMRICEGNNRLFSISRERALELICECGASEA